jgi:hypothetical protein
MRRLLGALILTAILSATQSGPPRALDKTDCGTSENGRGAKFYALTKAGPKHLDAKIDGWEQMTDLVGRFLEATTS